MLDLAILGLLDEQKMHGYELRKRLGELLGSRLAISFGSLYPALNRLEGAGLVEAVTDLPAPTVPTSPMSGSLTGELAALRARRRSAERTTTGGTAARGRGKKVYGVTDAGRRRLRELIVDPDVTDDRAFPVRVAFCQHVDPAERLELFERRRDELVRRRDQRRGAARSSGRLDTYLRALVERDTDALTADLAWLDRLIAGERSEADARPDPGGHP